MHHTPSGGAGSGTAAAELGPMSIGAVLHLLREEFPEVTISKIRFLESEGLVEPQRTPSGYRKFSQDDVRRLALVLRMQRDQYLPLKVIREHLDALDRGEPLPVPAQARDPLDAVTEAVEGVTADAAAAPGPRMGRAELLAAAGVGEAELGEWEAYGLVGPAPGGGYPAGTVEVARLVADLGRFGLEPRHLRAVKAAAEREAGLVEQVVAPLRRHRNPQTRARADATASEMAALSVRLHAALVQSALRVRLH
ncbi:MerR family transcriptional regulator [Streptomyces sp. 549]|uniref:transcriptional regulator FtsR n=1 Tax=Streptomyces sp. 549 TaxID=3049076 RepID=UPI0024C3151D|nr:MerR family transcriptional regulator [Streptomyces sp. 549]MDK1474463.1 MerR family transcriptional regulator [Streptomyces sp. 549]